MGKVYYDVSMSLDGFITSANPRPEAGLGDGGEQLHEWGLNSTDARNREIVESWGSTGAIIVRRTTYDLSIPYWGADGPMGTARVPTVIVSHIDEVSIHLVPVLFGSGTLLFGDLDSKHISLEPVEVIETPDVIHLRFRVVK